MRTLVQLQVGRPLELLSACDAITALITRVDASMSFRFRPMGKSKSAGIANEVPLDRVYLLVPPEVVDQGEPLAARRTFERFTTGVNVLVLCQPTNSSEFLFAELARIRPLASMRPLVDLQGAALVANVSAYVAVVRPLRGV